ncbi:MAG: transposase [Planctomycetes bacterium]|nr:transposase [Planctomycetota bacterium]
MIFFYLMNSDYDDFSIAIEGIKISANAPNMNAFLRVFIGSVRREAFDWFILFNEAQIRNILAEYIGYYNEKRPHQGIA